MHTQNYSRLPSVKVDASGSTVTNPPLSRRDAPRVISCRFMMTMALSWLISIILGCIVIHDRVNGADRFRQHKLYPAQLTYSPAQDAITYQVRKFHPTTLHAQPQFHGPSSDALDQAWVDLYNSKSLLYA